MPNATTHRAAPGPIAAGRRRRRKHPRLGRHLLLLALSVGVSATAVALASSDGTAPSEPAPPSLGLQAVTTTTTTTLSEPPGWSLLWSDEFDGADLDTTVWTPYHSTYGHANEELQCHTPDNVAVSGGTLEITALRQDSTCPNGARRAFSSGFVSTRETGRYFPRFGRFEIRARVPHGQGLWPAFWLRHRDGAKVAEVDVMEYFHAESPGEVKSSVYLDEGETVSRETIRFEEPTDDPRWHVWTVDIEPVPEGVQFSFYRDMSTRARPVAYHRFVDTAPSWADTHPGDDLWDVAVNLSVGGRWTGHPDGELGVLPDGTTCAQGGEPPCSAAGIRRASFPATYEVDYVRVYTKRGPEPAPEPAA
jgi:hypothetical protein